MRNESLADIAIRKPLLLRTQDWTMTSYIIIQGVMMIIHYSSFIIIHYSCKRSLVYHDNCIHAECWMNLWQMSNWGNKGISIAENARRQMYIIHNNTEQCRAQHALYIKENWYQGCISCGILVSGIGARGVSSEHMENMEMFSCSPT